MENRGPDIYDGNLRKKKQAIHMENKAPLDWEIAA